MFDLKTNPWLIRVHSEEEYNNVNEWLFENFGKKLIVNYDMATGGTVRGITNIDAYGKIQNYLMWLNDEHFKTCHKDVKEIEISFKTVVDVVEYPVVKTESELQLEQVMSKLSELQNEAQRLQEIVAKESK
nr:MAG TPA: hypothetical protein [Caudoviricetes sp.]